MSNLDYEYKLVTEETPAALENHVGILLAEGWQVKGGVKFGSKLWGQAMTRGIWPEPEPFTGQPAPDIAL